MNQRRGGRLLRVTEHGLVVIGVLCLLWAGGGAARAVEYQRRQTAQLTRTAAEGATAARDDAVAKQNAKALIGRLELPSVGLSAVVAEGDDDETLEVAVGHLPDTPLPWQEGNAALAGHRDTFFRPLRRVTLGDEIRFITPYGTFRYRVTGRSVVAPSELWVLAPSPAAALTLITCYPFDVIGPAPQRFVIHAARIAEEPRASNPRQPGAAAHDATFSPGAVEREK